MSLPAYDPDLHDISIDGIGFMMARPDNEAAPVSLMRSDVEPATSRAAVGDSSNENFSLSSFFFQDNFEGGVGQDKLLSADRGHSSIAETMHQGHIFPAKAVLTSGSSGGAVTGYFREGSTLYGLLATAVANVATNTQTSGALPIRTGQKIRTSAGGSSFWVTTSNTLLRKASGGAISDLTSAIPSGVTPYLFDLYGRFGWIVGVQTLESSATFVQSKTSGTATSKSITANFANPIQSQSVLVAIVRSFVSGGFSSVDITELIVPEGWISLGSESSTNYGINVYYCPYPTATQRTSTWQYAEGAQRSITIMEFKGVDQDDPIMYSTVETETTAWDISSIPATEGISIIAGYGNGTATGAPTGHTQVDSVAVYYDLDSTDTSITIPDSGLSQGASALVKLNLNAITTDLTQTVFLYTKDDGSTWKSAFNDGGSSGMPVPTASLAVGGSLWLTTEYGLYEFKTEDVAREDGTFSVLNAIRGPMDEFHYPAGTSYIGTALAAFDGSIYYNLGATLRRFPPGGRAEQIWPPRGFAAGGGNVISLTSGEGGVYFGTDTGFLWRYDGHGFHQIAKATADQLSVLHWHAGKLYLKGDPAPYFNYGYPSLRPDVSFPGPETYTTSYYISSKINLEKIGNEKVARLFETHAEFTAGTTTAQSGYIELQMLDASTGAHPHRFNPDSNTPAWVTIGTHSVEDGNVKQYVLLTPLRFKEIYLRLKLVPGSTGIPICEGYGIDGEALMSRRVRIAMMLSLSPDTKDRATGALYPTEADVAAAIDKLKSLRDPEHNDYTPFFDVVYRETGGTPATHTCIGEKFDDWLESHQGEDGAFSHVRGQFVVREIP